MNKKLEKELGRINEELKSLCSRSYFFWLNPDGVGIHVPVVIGLNIFKRNESLINHCIGDMG